MRMMQRRRRWCTGLVLALGVALLPTAGALASPTPGAPCAAPGTRTLVAGARLTCTVRNGRAQWIVTALPRSRFQVASDGVLGAVDKTWRAAGWAKYYGRGLGYKDAYILQGSTFQLTWRVTTASGAAMPGQRVTLLANKGWSESNATFITAGGQLVRKTVDGRNSGEFAGRTDDRGFVSFTLTDLSLQAEPADTRVDAVDALIQETGAVYGQFALRIGSLRDTAMAMDLVDVHVLAAPIPEDPAAMAANLPIGALLWSEEFTGPAGAAPDATKWTARYCGKQDANGGGTCYNNEVQYYVPEALALDGSEEGAAVITTRRITVPPPIGNCLATLCGFTSARFDTLGKVAFRYGYIEARIIMPRGGANWPAFWMLGAAGTANRLSPGEIDIVEGSGALPTRVSGAVHYPLEHGGAEVPRRFHASGSVSGVDTTNGWHTYGIAWLPDEIHFYVDGRRYFTASNLTAQSPFWPFNEPFFLILNNAVSPDAGFGGTYNGWTSAQMRIDFVRQYQLAGFGEAITRR